MSINQVFNDIKKEVNNLVANMNNNFVGPWDNISVGTICSNINELAYEVRNKNSELYEDLQNIKANLFYGQNIVNIFTLGRLIQIMRSYNYLSTNDIWQFVHPKIIELSKNKFEDGYYADAVQTAIVELCSIIRDYRRENGLPEIQSDKDMMYNTFSNQKILQFTDSSTTSLKNIQEGYEKIFPGVIQAMRNPHAHQNSEMKKSEAARKLMIASDLMYMLDKAIAMKEDVKI